MSYKLDSWKTPEDVRIFGRRIEEGICSHCNCGDKCPVQTYDVPSMLECKRVRENIEAVIQSYANDMCDLGKQYAVESITDKIIDKLLSLVEDD